MQKPAKGRQILEGNYSCCPDRGSVRSLNYYDISQLSYDAHVDLWNAHSHMHTEDSGCIEYVVNETSVLYVVH